MTNINKVGEISGLDWSEISMVVGLDLDSPRYIEGITVENVDDRSFFTMEGEELLIRDTRRELFNLREKYGDDWTNATKFDKKILNRLRDFTVKHAKHCLDNPLSMGDYPIKKGLRNIQYNYCFLKYLSLLLEEMWI